MAADPNEVRLLIEFELEPEPIEVRSVLLEPDYTCEVCGRDDGRAWVLGEDSDMGNPPICDDDFAVAATIIEVLAGMPPDDFGFGDESEDGGAVNQWTDDEGDQ